MSGKMNDLQEIKNQIKQQLDIKTVIEFYTGQKFKNNKILCPFHGEKTASFSLNEKEELFKCFGCGAGGDLIRFVEMYKKVEFIEAIEILAADFNIDINFKNYSDEELKKIKAVREEKNLIREIYRVALNYFQDNLKDDHINFIAEKYGLSRETIKKAKIGFCPGGLLEHLTGHGFTKEEIFKTGLITRKEGQFKDMYYSRLMIPYLKNGINYFTGRTLKENDQLKYLNLKHTSKYIKNPLYYARLKGKDTLILVEGEFDALAAAELTNFDVIALGKAGLSSQKQESLFKIVSNYDDVVIINDSDDNKAGQSGAIQTAKAILKGAGIICRVGQLEPIKGQNSTDIADYNKHGKSLNEVVNSAAEFVEILIEEIEEARNGRQAIKKAKSLYNILALIKEDFRGYYIGLIREAVGSVKGCNKSTLKKSKVESEIEKIINKESAKKKADQVSKDWFEINKNGGVSFKPAILAKHYLNSGHYITLADNIFKYKDGYFQAEAETIVNKNMMNENILGEHWETFRADSVIEYIKRATKENPKKLLNKNSFDNLINVKNGMIDLNSVEYKNSKINFNKIEMMKHSPEYKSFNQINANFKPEVKCPKVDQFVENILIDKNDPDYNKIKVFWEFVGWIIHAGEIELKKAIILVGPGDNGKTALLNFLKELIGDKNTAAVGLYDLVNNKYAAGDLFGKKANLAGEVSNNILNDIEMFKKLTGGDLIRADQKYKDPLEFTNRAKLIFALNTLPKVAEYEDAFFNRLIIFRTPNTFEKDDPEYDQEILKKVTTEKALAYGLKKAIEGFARLVVNDFKFTESAKVEKELINYIAQANTAIPFIKENCNLKPGAVTNKKDLYLVYKIWAKENGFGQMSSRKLTTRIKQGFNELKTTRLRFDGERLQAWKGLELKQSIQNNFSFN